LFDLDGDPFELANKFAAPSSRTVARELARELWAHSRRCKDAYADQPPVLADLAWAVGDNEKCVAPKRELKKAGKKTMGDDDDK
jgi:hypothetical protein